jgi:hypothetical protein
MKGKSRRARRFDLKPAGERLARCGFAAVIVRREISRQAFVIFQPCDGDGGSSK